MHITTDVKLSVSLLWPHHGLQHSKYETSSRCSRIWLLSCANGCVNGYDWCYWQKLKKINSLNSYKTDSTCKIYRCFQHLLRSVKITEHVWSYVKVKNIKLNIHFYAVALGLEHRIWSEVESGLRHLSKSHKNISRSQMTLNLKWKRINILHLENEAY